MRIRLEFARGEKMMYLSHLDLMRTFGRAIRRGGIPVRYTSGYNPHAQLVFGLPLQVGVTGDAEYLDIEVEDESYVGKVKEKLNNALPEGLGISDAREMKANENIMSVITHASYEMRVGRRAGANGTRGDICADLKNAVDAFLLPGPRIVEKTSGKSFRQTKNKRGKKNGGENGDNMKKTVDIAPLVRSVEARGDILAMIVTAGGTDNVKPDLVLDALNAIEIEMENERENEGEKEIDNVIDDNINGNESDNNSEIVVREGGFIKLSLCRKALFVERGGVLYKPIDDAICG